MIGSLYFFLSDTGRLHWANNIDVTVRINIATTNHWSTFRGLFISGV